MLGLRGAGGFARASSNGTKPTETCAYDQRGSRPTRETLPGGKGTLKREYDARGNRTSMTDPKGKKVTYAHDAANRLTSVAAPEGETTYGYDDDNRPLGVAYPNGTGETRSYDPLGRVASVTVARGTSGEILSKLDYAYDEGSNPTSITDQAGKKSAFTYDALDRITKEAHPEATIGYAYDAAGNRKSMARSTSAAGGAATATVTTAYDYDEAERMTRAGEETFTYDNNGNMTGSSDGSATTGYSYDYEDRLVRAGDKTYERDALGRVASTVEGGEQTDYDFDGSEVIREVTASGEDVDYTRGLAKRLISRQQGGSSSYYHHDAIGSVVGLSDSTGALTDSFSYDAFGEELSRTGTSEQPYRYLGNRHDPQSGLYDFHARAYDPEHGRFTSKDPIRGKAKRPQSLNPHACSLNNPLRFPDPSGLFPGDLEDQYGETLTGAEEDPYAGVEQYSGGCPEVPVAPEEGPDGEPVDIDQNIREAEDIWLPTFADRVQEDGDQDYKQQYPQYYEQYDDIGNFNFGATGAAQGLPDEVLYTAGGADQYQKDKENGVAGRNGRVIFGEYYGDERDDYEQINAGIDYYENGCGDF